MNSKRLNIEDPESLKLLKSDSLFKHISDVEEYFSVNESPTHSFADKINITSKKSVVLTVFNIFRSFVAVAILTLPYATSLVGPIPAIFCLIFVAVIVFLATDLVLEVADDSRFKGANYETLGKMMWGQPGKQLILVVLYLCSLACFIGGILFSAEFLNFAFCSHGIHSLCNRKSLFMLIAFFLCIVIALIESLKPFGYISIASTCVIIIGLASITFYNVEFLLTTEIDLKVRINQFHIEHVLSFLGIALYTTEGLNLVIPLRHSFKDNENFPKLLYGTFTFVVWCYITTGILSYMVSS